MTPNIIKIRFLKDGAPTGRAYSYYTNDNLSVGDIVQANEHAKGIVTEIDVAEEEVADIKHLVKFIRGKIEVEPC